MAMPDLNGQSAQVAKEKPIGSFSRMQKAVSALREASAEVSALASGLVGPEPDKSEEAYPDAPGGALLRLDDEADEVARSARDIIKQVKRIREKAC